MYQSHRGNLTEKYRLFLPTMSYFHDAVFRQMIGDALQLEGAVEVDYLDLDKEQMNTLRQRLTPDLLLEGTSEYDPNRTSYGLSKSKVIDQFKDKPKFPQIFSTRALQQISSDLENTEKDTYQSFVKFLGGVVDQLVIGGKGGNIRCDECGSFMVLGDSEKRGRDPEAFKVWPTLNKYTPGRLRYAMSAEDTEGVRSRMGNSFRNIICPLCLWKEIIDTVIRYQFIKKLEDRKKHLLVLFEFIDDGSGIANITALNLAYRFNLSSNEEKVEFKKWKLVEEEGELYNIIDNLNPDDFIIFTFNDKTFIQINAKGLELIYRTKTQKKKIQLKNYVDGDIRLKKEANLLYSVILKSLESVTFNGGRISDKLTVCMIDDTGLRVIDTSEGEKILRLMLFAEEKYEGHYPFFRSRPNDNKPLTRWRYIQRFMRNPVSEFGIIIRWTYGLQRQKKEKKVRQKGRRKEGRKLFIDTINKYYEGVKSILNNETTEIEFVKTFTEFLYGLPTVKESETLAKWKIIQDKRQESSYEQPLRDFFRILRKQQNIEQTLAEFMTRLSRQGLDMSRLDVKVVDDFQKFCERKLDKVNEKNAINISMFVIYRTLYELNERDKKKSNKKKE